jgi:hypothetical protein
MAAEKIISPNSPVIGTEIDKCPICKQTRKLLVLKYGFKLCEDCLEICVGILDYLQQQENKSSHPQHQIKTPIQKKTLQKSSHKKIAKISSEV